MAAALCAVDFRAGHEMAVVHGGLDSAGERVAEAGPARAAVELGLAYKERIAAARAFEGAGALLVIMMIN